MFFLQKNPAILEDPLMEKSTAFEPSKDSFQAFTMTVEALALQRSVIGGTNRLMQIFVNLKIQFHLFKRPPVTVGLTHWGGMMHICVSKLIIIVSDDGLPPGRCQAIIWTSDGILIPNLGTNFSEILSEIHIFSFKKNAFESVVYEMADILSWPQCVKHEVNLEL